MGDCYLITDDGYVFTFLWFDTRAGLIVEQADCAEVIPYDC